MSHIDDNRTNHVLYKLKKSAEKRDSSSAAAAWKVGFLSQIKQSKRRMVTLQTLTQPALQLSAALWMEMSEKAWLQLWTL